MNQNNKQTVVLGMSGGVDSSVAVYLLQQAGYRVIGVHMLMIPEKYATNLSAPMDAAKVAEHLGIEFHIINLRQEFEEIVIGNFIEQYSLGKTPNPCIVCNQQIKFNLFAKAAWKLNADFIATGHYAKIERNSIGAFHLKKGDDIQKDQSYFLSQIDATMLDRILFPLSAYSKEEIRGIARKLNLEVANKSDSQEICFIPDNNYKLFLERWGSPWVEGYFIGTDGKQIGKHQGIQQYTIGQRKGLGIALGKPAYVVNIDAKTRSVIVGDEKELYHKGLISKENNFLTSLPINTPILISAKVRYRALPATAKMLITDQNEVTVIFDEPQRAITPGQSVCFYQDDIVLGGGIIYSWHDNDF